MELNCDYRREQQKISSSAARRDDIKRQSGEDVMRTIKGPGLFLAQFARDTPPHNSLEGIAKWAKNYGYKAIQIPTWDARFFNLDLAHESPAYCDEIKGKLGDIGIAVSE